jgi:hypothetical protein
MNLKEEHLLKNYYELLPEKDRMVARWLVEEWDRESEVLPRWLRNNVRGYFPFKYHDKPSALARIICLKLLGKHKNKISLRS